MDTHCENTRHAEIENFISFTRERYYNAMRVIREFEVSSSKIKEGLATVILGDRGCWQAPVSADKLYELVKAELPRLEEEFNKALALRN